MILAFELLFFLGVFCKLISCLVSTGSHFKVDSMVAMPADACKSSISSFHNLNEPLSQTRNARFSFASGQCGSRPNLTKRNVAVLPDTYPLDSLDLMRKVYGPRRKWWGDLNAQQTRAFYHELLPKDLQDELCTLTLEEKARRASMARHAARLYARERCSLPSRITAVLYDGFRHLKNYGTWNSEGLTWDELYKKYETQIRAQHPNDSEDMIRDAVIRRILEKSCCTNKLFDELTKTKPRNSSSSQRNSRKRWKRKLLVAGKRVIRQPKALLSQRTNISRGGNSL